MRVAATPLILLIGGLWIAIIVLGLFGQWFPALLLSVPLMGVHLILGSAHDGKISTALLIHPILTWAVVWVGSFVLAEVFARAFAGGSPDFTILGLHPSFACIVFGYWIGGVATLTVGFSRRRHLWMTDEQWTGFSQKVAQLNESMGAEDPGVES